MSQAKQQRQRLIADWLRQHRIGSQEELVARLDLAGLPATQATVSRDLDELGAVRIRRDGAMHYRLPDQPEIRRAIGLTGCWPTGSPTSSRPGTSSSSGLRPARRTWSPMRSTPRGSRRWRGRSPATIRFSWLWWTASVPGAFAEGLRRRREGR